MFWGLRATSSFQPSGDSTDSRSVDLRCGSSSTTKTSAHQRHPNRRPNQHLLPHLGPSCHKGQPQRRYLPKNNLRISDWCTVETPLSAQSSLLLRSAAQPGLPRAPRSLPTGAGCALRARCAAVRVTVLDCAVLILLMFMQTHTEQFSCHRCPTTVPCIVSHSRDDRVKRISHIV